MGISLGSVSTTSAESGGGTIPVNFVSSPADGDLLLVFCNFSYIGTMTFPGWPSGWTSVDSAISANGGGTQKTQLQVGYKIWHTGDSTANFSIAEAAGPAATSVMVSYKGTKATGTLGTDFIAHGITASLGATTSFVSPTVNNTGYGVEWRVIAYGSTSNLGNAAVTTGTYSPTDTERADFGISTGATASLSVIDSNVGIATGNTHGTATASASSCYVPWTGILATFPPSVQGRINVKQAVMRSFNW